MIFLPIAAALALAAAPLVAGSPYKRGTCPPPNGSFQVHPNGNTAYCLSVASPGVSGSVATVQKCDGSAGQAWYFDVQSYTDTVHLRTYGDTNNECLAAEVYRISAAYNGRQLALTGCYNDGAQGWGLTSSGTIQMQGQVDGQNECMDLRDGNLNGGAVQIWYCVQGNTNQQWTTS